MVAGPSRMRALVAMAALAGAGAALQIPERRRVLVIDDAGPWPERANLVEPPEAHEPLALIPTPEPAPRLAFADTRQLAHAESKRDRKNARRLALLSRKA